MKRSEAEQLVVVLKGPEFAHWVRQATVHEETTGNIYITCYVVRLTSLLVAEIERACQQFGAAWQAEPSSTTQFILIRILGK